MSMTKIAITLLALTFSLGAIGCNKEKKAVEAKPAAECKLAGDWTDESGNFKVAFDTSNADAFGSGTAMMGEEEKKIAFAGSAADVKKIESGNDKASTINYTVGDAGEDCKMMFSNECENVVVQCATQTVTMMRAK